MLFVKHFCHIILIMALNDKAVQIQSSSQLRSSAIQFVPFGTALLANECWRIRVHHATPENCLASLDPWVVSDVAVDYWYHASCLCGAVAIGTLTVL